MNNQNKIEKFIPPLYEGQNTEMRYRYLGFLPAMAIGYELIKSRVTLLSRYKYPGGGLTRKIPYHPLSPKTLQFFIYTVPAYLLFDLIYRNNKYMKNATTSEKLGYTADLALFHLLATIYLPYKIVHCSALSLPMILSHITRSRIPLMAISTAAFIWLGLYQVKAIDILIDMLLDSTFRKFYNYQKEGKIGGSNQFKQDTDKIKSLIQISHVVLPGEVRV